MSCECSNFVNLFDKTFIQFQLANATHADIMTASFTAWSNSHKANTVDHVVQPNIPCDLIKSQRRL